MKRILILAGILLAVVGPIRSSASEPEPNWTNRYLEVKQQLLDSLKPPAVGQTVTITRRIGGEYTGRITSISSNSVAMGGNRYEARQLTDETCEKLFPESNAAKLARQQITRERDAFRERQETDRRKADEAARVLAKAEEQKRLAAAGHVPEAKGGAVSEPQPTQAPRTTPKPASPPPPPAPASSDSTGSLVVGIVFAVIVVVALASAASRRKGHGLSVNASGSAVCPKCGSTNIQATTEGETQGFGAGKGCLGLLLFGPIGFLCGLCGMGKGKTNAIRMCMACGKKF